MQALSLDSQDTSWCHVSGVAVNQRSAGGRGRDRPRLLTGGVHPGALMGGGGGQSRGGDVRGGGVSVAVGTNGRCLDVSAATPPREVGVRRVSRPLLSLRLIPNLLNRIPEGFPIPGLIPNLLDPIPE
eukprot:g27362.t1